MSTAALSHDPRPAGPALLRGWQRRCPACGEGAMMEGMLKVRDHCPACGEALHHHRADDGPAYLTILIVGKLTMAIYVPVWLAFDWPPLAMVALFWTLALALSLYLLPRLKGAIVGLQWAKRMHGFEGPGDWTRDPSDPDPWSHDR